MLVLENEVQLRKALQLPLEQLGMLAVVQYAGAQSLCRPADCPPHIATRFLSVSIDYRGLLLNACFVFIYFYIMGLDM